MILPPACPVLLALLQLNHGVTVHHGARAPDWVRPPAWHGACTCRRSDARSLHTTRAARGSSPGRSCTSRRTARCCGRGSPGECERKREGGATGGGGGGGANQSARVGRTGRTAQGGALWLEHLRTAAWRPCHACTRVRTSSSPSSPLLQVVHVVDQALALGGQQPAVEAWAGLDPRLRSRGERAGRRVSVCTYGNTTPVQYTWLQPAVHHNTQPYDR